MYRNDISMVAATFRLRDLKDEIHDLVEFRKLKSGKRIHRTCVYLAGEIDE